MADLPTPYQQFIAKSRYARWLPTEMRKETWEESVDRYMTFLTENVNNAPKPKTDGLYEEIRTHILNLEVMPSMRCIMSAGPALKFDNITGYNCFPGYEEFMYWDKEEKEVYDISFEEAFERGGQFLVLTQKRKWAPATVQSFGSQPIQRVTLRKLTGSPDDVTISYFDVTPDHCWPVWRRGLVTDLQVGDVLSYADEDGVITMGFRVDAIRDTGRTEPVYCCVVNDVEETHTFTLANGAVTHNCSYLPIDHPYAFDETLYILMCGAGVGFSVERKYIEKLPIVPSLMKEDVTDQHTVHVMDSRQGWANALRKLLKLLYDGVVPAWNTSRVRPAGAPLKTMGGRASGPGPLEDLFAFVVQTFKNARGRRLSPFECHCICCFIGDIVVVGGVRRSALISFSDLNDTEMRDCKSGSWWETRPYLMLANNSAVYDETPSISNFMDEWNALYKSKSGERGIYNTQAAVNHLINNVPRRRANTNLRTNPCSEILLRPNSFCNLSEVVVRSTDREPDLKRKVRIATIIGTLQSTLTNFKHLRPIWKKNTEEERLLGVSLTGIYDNPLTYTNSKRLADLLTRLKGYAVSVNEEWAQRLGINQSSAITCVKPSGTVSQLVDSASGIHPRWSQYYIRTVRSDKKDPICHLMKDQGVPCEDCVMKPRDLTVFSFPVQSPQYAVTRERLGVLDHLELWKTYACYWCEHKPSCTINIKESEWITVANWVYSNFTLISGISFLPYSEHTYRQAPYTEVDKYTYAHMLKQMPLSIDWNKLKEYEGAQEVTHHTFACTGDKCEIVDLV